MTFIKGKAPWNKGLTKEDAPGIMVHSIRMKGDRNISKRPEVKWKMHLAKFRKPSNNKGKHWKIKNTTNMGKHLKGIPKAETIKEILRQKAKQRVAEGKHNFWKGGITPIVIEIKNQLEYREWRTEVFKRDNYKCYFGCKNKSLIAHHIFFFSDIMHKFNIKSLQDALNCSVFWNVNNGLTVCEDCHNKIHSECQINQYNKN